MGADDTVDGMSKITRFKKEPFPQILVSVNMLDTGFDCPEVVQPGVRALHPVRHPVPADARPRHAQGQAASRSSRCSISSASCDYHGDDDAMGEGGMVIAKPKPRKTYEPRRLLSLDIDDHIDPTTREWITVDEDGNMVFPEASEQKAAELGARFEAWLLTQTGLTPSRSAGCACSAARSAPMPTRWDEVSRRALRLSTRSR